MAQESIIGAMIRKSVRSIGKVSLSKESAATDSSGVLLVMDDRNVQMMRFSMAGTSELSPYVAHTAVLTSLHARG